MIHYTTCPVCGSGEIEEVLQVKDFTVSGEIFPVWHCHTCTARFTNDIPGQDGIGSYYQSENYISHSDTRAGLMNRLYHAVRKVTARGKLNLLKKYCRVQKGNLLDIGAGTGFFMQQVKQGGWQVQGIEPDAGARQKAKELYGLDLDSPPGLFNLPASGFQAITLWHVLEHVHDLHTYLDQLKKLLAPGGKLFIAVPNYTAADALYYKDYWAAWDVPRHLYHFSPASMKSLLTRHGFNTEAVLPMWFDSYYVSMLSEKYKNGKDAMLKAAMQGNLSNARALGNKEKCSSLIYVAG